MRWPLALDEGALNLLPRASGARGGRRVTRAPHWGTMARERGGRGLRPRRASAAGVQHVVGVPAVKPLDALLEADLRVIPDELPGLVDGGVGVLDVGARHGRVLEPSLLAGDEL